MTTEKFTLVLQSDVVYSSFLFKLISLIPEHKKQAIHLYIINEK